MPELYAELTELSSAQKEVAATATSLAEERRTIGATMESLLTTWQDPVAEEFSQAWAQWCEGADKVAAGLHELAVAIDQTRHDLQHTDAVGASTMTRVQADESRAARRLGGGAGAAGGAL